jgi:hypothetical protein
MACREKQKAEKSLRRKNVEKVIIRKGDVGCQPDSIPVCKKEKAVLLTGKHKRGREVSVSKGAAARACVQQRKRNSMSPGDI